jgi:hypothetical protein
LQKSRINKKFDYILPGSIAAGSKKQEAMHKAELAKWFKTEAECAALIAAKKKCGR